MKLLDRNLDLLSFKQPYLADQIRNTPSTTEIICGTSKTGQSVAKINGRSLHSWVDPVKEAVKITEQVNFGTDDPLYVYGFGFGYHLRELLKKSKELHVVEPSIDILRASMESIDFSDILEKITIIYNDSPCKIAADMAHLDTTLFVHPASAVIFADHHNVFIDALEAASSIPPLRILVVGPIYGGSLPTAQYINQSLIEMGHQTCFVDSSMFDDSFHKINGITGNQRSENCIRNKYNDFLGETVIAKAVDFVPDIVISVAQAPLSENTINRLKQADIPIAFWFVEDFRTLTYWKEIGPHYDYFFPIQRGEFTDLLKRAGVKNCHYLPQACFPPIHRARTLTPTEQSFYESDISFVGAGYYNRLKFFQGFTHFNFKIWGSDWNKASSLYSLVQKDGMRLDPTEYVKIFQASRINLNLHSSLFHEGVDPTGDFVNPRTFELAACGAFQLVDNRSELPELFEPGKEIICFDNHSDLNEKIRYFLAHKEETLPVIQRGLKRALGEHTFKSRLTLMLTVIWMNEREKIESHILNRSQKKKSVNSLDNMLKEAKGDSQLLGFLSRFKESGSVSLKNIMDSIADTEGPITRPEALFIMINEILTERDEKGTNP